VAAAKAANTAEPDTHDYSEADTRKAFIDVLLREAGWVLNPARNFEVEVSGMPQANGGQQAKLYADRLERQYGQRPVIFTSNGYEHWLWDDLAYPQRPVQGFYKRAELELLVQRRSSRHAVANDEW
jgi:type I restriction enzyme R subunit